ncbi:YqaE/Pmp3 family membrane protein [Flavobacterium sp. GT3P67]|uniref:YqaE/Pmp3 family membrane protein n=1 Tax=Flavobacterium sp. GT3P67 TaxID=2541722 RepID=UPI0010439D53|nr:YqaE/Pmp3 family membrane protein [Flavobacterium sp. GT3P67]TDE53954.1 YqaE/Pmp3 family membrane protein [Flavobacterium sp. GT3P67]
MRYVLAFFLPWLSLLLQGKIVSGICCLILQITIIGWIPACIWAFTALNRMYADRRTTKIIMEMRRVN